MRSSLLRRVRYPSSSIHPAYVGQPALHGAGDDATPRSSRHRGGPTTHVVAAASMPITASRDGSAALRAPLMATFLAVFAAMSLVVLGDTAGKLLTQDGGVAIVRRLVALRARRSRAAAGPRDASRRMGRARRLAPRAASVADRGRDRLHVGGAAHGAAVGRVRRDLHQSRRESRRDLHPVGVAARREGVPGPRRAPAGGVRRGADRRSSLGRRRAEHRLRPAGRSVLRRLPDGDAVAGGDRRAPARAFS